MILDAGSPPALTANNLSDLANKATVRSNLFPATGLAAALGNAINSPGGLASSAGPTFSGTILGTYTLGGTPTITAPTINGGALSGIFSGAPTFPGNLTFSGDPFFTGLSVGSCVFGLGVNVINQTILMPCTGSAASIQQGVTTVTSATGSNRLHTNGTVTAGTGVLTDVPATVDSSGNLAGVNSLAGSVIATKAAASRGDQRDQCCHAERCSKIIQAR